MNIKQEIFHKTIAKSVNRSFYASIPNLPNLPLIFSCPPLESSSQAKIKDNIMDLKKKLIQKVYNLKELKLANSKLKTSKHDFDKLYFEALDENNKSDRPIDETDQESPTHFILSNESYSKLKTATSLSLLKHQISLIKRMTKEKDEEILKLLTDSKVVKLIEKDNQLKEYRRNILSLNESIGICGLKIIEQEKKTAEDIITKDNVKAIHSSAKNETETLREQLRTSKQQTDKHIANINTLEEKGKQLLFQYNAIKPLHKKKEKELNDKKQKVASIEKMKEDIEKYASLKLFQDKEIEELTNEGINKSKELREVEEMNKDLIKILEDNNVGLKKIRVSDANAYEVCKRDQQRIETEIMKIAKENSELMKQIPQIDCDIAQRLRKECWKNYLSIIVPVSNINTHIYDSTSYREKMAKTNKEFLKESSEEVKEGINDDNNK